MPKPKPAIILSKFFKPTRILLVAMFVIILWFSPPFTLTRVAETSAVPHIQIADAQDEDPCFVCTQWKLCSPGDHNPDTSGMCCLKGHNICTDQPPSISGVLNCAQWGSNGWCVGYETIDLSASDPGGNAVMISGDVNGVPFACPNQNTSTLSCSVPLPQGAGAINYTVTSMSGLTASNSAGYQLDTSTPQVSGTLNGSGGTNNWFVSNVILSASASDSVSGVASLQTNVDGDGWMAYTAPLTLTDGIHNVVVYAVDYAGNTNQTTQTVQVDTLTPTLNLSVAGTTGSNGWYTSTVQISAESSDGGSGLATLEVSQDGSAYVPYTDPISFSDGIHAYQFKATDNAGNVTETTQSIQVDTLTPGIALNLSGTQGLGGWYTSSVNISAVANDGGSGVAQLQVARDGGSYIPYTAPVNFSDGVHTYQFKATDISGNVTETPLQTVYVDTIFPAISMSEDAHLGDTIYFSLQDDGSQLSEVRVVIFDGNERYDKIAWIESVAGKKYKDQFLWDGKFADGTLAPAGTYYVKLKVTDAAGNETIKTSTVTVDMFRFLDVIPPFRPPGSPLSAGEDTTLSSNSSAASSSPNSNFGGTASGNPPASSSASLSSGGVVNPFTQGGGSVSFGSNSTNTQSANLPTSGILWGAAATAAIGAFAAEIQKKKEEEEAARAAAQMDEGVNGYRSKVHERKWRASEIEGEKKKAAELAAKQAAADAARAALIAKNEDRAPLDMDKVNQLVEQAKARAADAARWEGLASQGQYAANIPPVQKETSWLSSIPFVGPALDTAWQNSSVKIYWDNTVYPHVIQPINDAVTKIGQRNIAKIALTLLAATGIIVVTALPIQTNSTFGICDIPVINWFCSLISPASSPTPTIDLTAVRTQAAQTVIAQISQTVMAVTPPPPTMISPMVTQASDSLRTEIELSLLSQWLVDHRNDPAVQQWLVAHGLLNSADIGNDTKLLEAVNQAVIPWQNQYNADIQRIATVNNIPPDYLKALFLQENQFGWTPVLDNPNANGPGQLFGWGLDMAFNNGNAPDAYIKDAYERSKPSGRVFYDTSGNPVTPYDPQFHGSYQSFYQSLSPDSQTSIRGFAIPFINLTCDNYEACSVYGGLKPDEAVANLEVSAQALVGAKNIAQGSIGDSTWNQMPASEQLKFTIAIYNSGGGTCVGGAVSKTRDSGGNPGSWDQVKVNLGSNCTAAGVYVDGVISYLP